MKNCFIGGMPSPSQCVVCGTTSDVVVWRENGYEGRSCSCGTVYTSPAPPAGAVDPAYDGHPSCFYSAYAEFKTRWVSGIKPAGRLLEIGCGEGHFLRQARAAGYEVSGVDANPERARHVARTLGVEVRCGLFEELPFPQKYDVVYHCDLLSHFPEPVGTLKKMSSILNPGGVLAFEVGTMGGVHPAWYRWIGLVGYPQHRWLYSEASLQSLFNQAGLRVLRTRRFGVGPSILFMRSVGLAAKFAKRRPAHFPLLSEEGRLRHQETLERRRRGGVVEYVEQFLRYRAGALVPWMGPGTLFVAACPRGMKQEVS